MLKNREKLLATKTEANPKVIEIDEQIKELEAQKIRVNKEGSEQIIEEGAKVEKNAEREVIASLRSQLAAAQQREAKQRTAFEQASAKANADGQAETQLVGKRREIESNRSLLDTYIQRQKEQELALSSGRPNNIKIQNHAVAPSGPIGPQRTRNILVALLISFAAGIDWRFARLSDDRFRIRRHQPSSRAPTLTHSALPDIGQAKAFVSRTGFNGPATRITMDEPFADGGLTDIYALRPLSSGQAAADHFNHIVTGRGKTTTAIA